MNALHPLLLTAAIALPAHAADAPARDSHGDPLPQGAVARFGSARLRHGGVVTSVAFAPDGKTVASASFDRTVSLWDADNGRELVRYVGHSGDVRSVVFLRDGRTLVSCSADGDIRLWDVPKSLPADGPQDGKLLQILRPEGASPEALAVSLNGKQLASGNGDGIILIWDLATRKVARRLDAEFAVHNLAFTPDSRELASKGKDGAICVWDLATSTARLTITEPAVFLFALSPDGNSMATGSFSGQVRLWDATTGQELKQFGGHPSGRSSEIYGVAFAPDGRTFATAGADGIVRMWEPSSGKEVRRFEGHVGRVRALAFSRDGKRLVTGGGDHTVRIWDTATGKETVSSVAAGAINDLSIAADGKTLAIVHAPGRLEMWDVATRKTREMPKAVADLDVRAAAFVPRQPILALGVAPGSVRLLDLATNTFAFVGDDREGPLAPLVATPDGAILFGGLYRAVVRRELPGGKLAAGLQRKFDTLSCLAVAPDGRTLAGGGGAAAIRLWRAGASDFEELPGHPGGLLAVAFGSDGRTLASGGKDRLIRIWEIASGKERKRFGGFPGWVRCIAYSPDGKVLASGGTDGVVRLWDALTGREMAEFMGHRGVVAAINFAADGNRLYSGGADATVLVWDLAGVPRTPRPDAVTFRKDQLDDFWTRLGGDGSDALLAIQYLARTPGQTVPLLRERVKPVDPARIERLLKDLDSDEFDTRENATNELATLGQQAEPTLRVVLKGRISPERRRRINELLAKLNTGETAPEVLRAVRAVEVLEMIGSDEARKLVETLAAGAKDFELTVQAKAALGRMRK